MSSPIGGTEVIEPSLVSSERFSFQNLPYHRIPLFVKARAAPMNQESHPSAQSPLRVRMFDQVCIEIPRIPCHFVPDPSGFLNGLALALQLHLGHDQALVLTEKLVHLPGQAAS